MDHILKHNVHSSIINETTILVDICRSAFEFLFAWICATCRIILNATNWIITCDTVAAAALKFFIFALCCSNVCNVSIGDSFGIIWRKKINVECQLVDSQCAWKIWIVCVISTRKMHFNILKWSLFGFGHNFVL